jgi:hypothetical protein
MSEQSINFKNCFQHSNLDSFLLPNMAKKGLKTFFFLLCVKIIRTFLSNGLGIFLPRSFMRNSCPNFCKLENVNSAANSVPSISSSTSPCIAMLKLKPSEGSAPVRKKGFKLVFELIMTFRNEINVFIYQKFDVLLKFCSSHDNNQF